MYKLVLLVAVFVVLAIPVSVNAAGNTTVFVFDEDSQQASPYTILITNATGGAAGTNFVTGRISSFDSFIDVSGSSWAESNEGNACDFDTGTEAVFNCVDADNCDDTNTEIFQVFCDIGIPHYSSINNNNFFNITLRGYASTGSRGIIISILDVNTQVYGDSATVTLASGGTPSTSRVGTSEFQNTNGRYGTAGTATIRISSGGTVWNLNNVAYISDIWGMLGAVSTGTGGNTTAISSWTREISRSNYIGGIPEGSVTATIEADMFGTALDRSSRNYFFTTSTTADSVLRAYSLLTSQGCGFQFVIRDQVAGNVEGATITGQRNINGSYLTIDQALTDTTGVGTLFLKDGTDYIITISATGFAGETITATPNCAVANSRTVFLESTTVGRFNTDFGDVSYLFRPTGSTVPALSVSTINLSLLAFQNNLDLWGFNITKTKPNGSSTLVGNFTSTSASGGFLEGQINLTLNATNGTNYDTLLVTGFIEYIGEDPIFFERDYLVLSLTPSNNSFLNIMNNIQATTNIDTFTLNLIALFTAMMFAGFMRMKGFGTYGTGLIALTIMGVFVFFGFLNFTFYVIMLLVVIGIYALNQRGNI